MGNLRFPTQNHQRLHSSCLWYSGLSRKIYKTPLCWFIIFLQWLQYTDRGVISRHLIPRMKMQGIEYFKTKTGIFKFSIIEITPVSKLLHGSQFKQIQVQ
jgi:hypothetical protein